MTSDSLWTAFALVLVIEGLLPFLSPSAWRLDDAPALARHANNRRVWANLRDRFPHPFSVEDGAAYIAYTLREPVPLSFAIDVGGEAVGGITLHPGEDVDAAHRREAAAVRRSVGIVDVSTLGKIEVQGPDAGEFLDRVYVNGFSGLPVGKARYGVMLRDDGIVLDDGTTARLEIVDDGVGFDTFEHPLGGDDMGGRR